MMIKKIPAPETTDECNCDEFMNINYVGFSGSSWVCPKHGRKYFKIKSRELK